MLSRLHDHKLQQNFLKSYSNCGTDIETTVHYFLHFPNFSDDRFTLTKNIRNIGNNILDLSNSRISEALFFVTFLLMIQNVKQNTIVLSSYTTLTFRYYQVSHGYFNEKWKIVEFDSGLY